MNLKYIYKSNKYIILTCCIFVTMTLLITCLQIKKCHAPYHQKLVCIDSLCNTNPESAKIELNKIQHKYNSNDNENHWYYNFLLLKVRVKTNEKNISISEITELINHYERNGNKQILSQVYYCAGCIYRNLKDIMTSNKFFLKCLEMTEKIKDLELRSLVYYQLGHNLSTQGLHNEALKYQLKSLQYDKKHNHLIRTFYDSEDLAWTFGSINNSRKAFEYLNAAKVIAYKINEKEQMSEIECQLAIFEMERNHLKEAKKHIDTALKLSQGRNNSELNSTALEIYSKYGLKDKAKIYCDSVIRNGNIYGKKYAYWWLSEYHCKVGNLQSTLHNIKKYKEYSDSVSIAVSSEASAKANALYNYGIKEKENIILKKENAVQTSYIILILSIFIISFLIFCIVYMKIKKKRGIIEKRYNMLTYLREKEKEANEDIIKQKEKEIEDIRRMLFSIKENNMQKKIELENALNMKENKLIDINNDATMKKISDENLKRSEIYKHIMNLTSNNETIKDEDWDTLKQTIFCIYPTFEEKLSELDTMNNTELKVCMLIRIGLNAGKIANLICKSQNTIYSINRRLYHKNFGKYVAPSEWEKFIRTIY